MPVDRAYLYSDYIYRNVGCFAEKRDVSRVRREDLIAIDGQKGHGRIDDVARARAGQKGPDPTPQFLIERGDIDRSKKPRKVRCGAASSPSLAHDPAMGLRHSPGEPFALEDGTQHSIAAIDRDQRASVEDDRH